MPRRALAPTVALVVAIVLGAPGAAVAEPTPTPVAGNLAGAAEPTVFPPPLPLAATMRGAFAGDLAPGDEGPGIEVVQRRLAELRIDPGAIDGHLGDATKYAVYALQKLHGLEPTGVVDQATWDALAGPTVVTPRVPTGAPDRIEVDIDAQMMVVWDDDQVALISHVSTGSGLDYCEDGVCGNATTPRGSYTIQRRIPGWRIARLGGLYNPLYFRGGFALHGSRSVPTHPASHGCVRLPMHVADLLPPMVPNGEQVYVFDAEHPPQPLVDPARVQVPAADPFA